MRATLLAMAATCVCAHASAPTTAPPSHPYEQLCYLTFGEAPPHAAAQHLIACVNVAAGHEDGRASLAEVNEEHVAWLAKALVDIGFEQAEGQSVRAPLPLLQELLSQQKRAR